MNYIFSESDKLLSDSLRALTNVTNRSTYILMIYLSVLSFSFIKIVDGNFWFYLTFISSIVSSVILIKNILPVKTSKRGLDLDFFKDEYFEGKDDPEKIFFIPK